MRFTFKREERERNLCVETSELGFTFGNLLVQSGIREGVEGRNPHFKVTA